MSTTDKADELMDEIRALRAEMLRTLKQVNYTAHIVGNVLIKTAEDEEIARAAADKAERTKFSFPIEYELMKGHFQ